MNQFFKFASLRTGITILIAIGMVSPIFASDYFESQVLRTNNRESSREALREIQINEVALKSSSERLRLSQTKFFISKTKREMVNRYSEGGISAYDFADIEQELRYLSKSMNSYFSNIRAFERSKNEEFQKMAKQNLDEAHQSYSRLKAATRKAARTN